MLDAYVGDYLEHEIAAESLVRNLPAFSDFLAAASLSDAEIVNQLNIARECGVSASTVAKLLRRPHRHPPRALVEGVHQAAEASGDPST